MIVDWLRACYESDFCVDTLTGETIRGRYYWAPPGAQVFPGPHRFASAVWLDKEERGGLGYLGDQFSNVSKDDGATPEVRPLARRFDNKDNLNCSQSGGTSMVLTSDTYGGLPRACYRTDLLNCLPYDAATDPHAVETWCWVATVCQKLYAGDVTVLDYLATKVPGITHSVKNLSGTGTLPQYVMWKAACGRGIICAGTNNFQQAVMQVFYGSTGPSQCGQYYSSRFWFDASETLRTTFKAECGPHQQRTFLGGHSYGGAAVGLLAATEAAETNLDEYALLTIGAPRLGNGQVYQRLSAINSVFLQNEGDPVPSFPPTYPTLTDLLAIVGPLYFFFLQRWAPPPTQTVIRPDGTTYQSNAWNGGATTATAIAGIIADRGLMPTFNDHKIEEYRARICPPDSAYVPHFYYRAGLSFWEVRDPVNLVLVLTFTLPLVYGVNEWTASTTFGAPYFHIDMTLLDETPTGVHLKFTFRPAGVEYVIIEMDVEDWNFSDPRLTYTNLVITFPPTSSYVVSAYGGFDLEASLDPF